MNKMILNYFTSLLQSKGAVTYYSYLVKFNHKVISKRIKIISNSLINFAPEGYYGYCKPNHFKKVINLYLKDNRLQRPKESKLFR